MAVGTRGAAGIQRLSRENFQSEVLEAEGTVLVIFQRNETDGSQFFGVLEKVRQEVAPDVRMVRALTSDFEDLIREWKANRGYQTYDLDNLPAMGLFRQGRLITTFNPRMVSRERGVIDSKVGLQFKRFLDKFIHYDPEKLTFNHK